MLSSGVLAPVGTQGLEKPVSFRRGSRLRDDPPTVDRPRPTNAVLLPVTPPRMCTRPRGRIPVMQAL